MNLEVRILKELRVDFANVRIVKGLAGLSKARGKDNAPFEPPFFPQGKRGKPFVSQGKEAQRCQRFAGKKEGGGRIASAARCWSSTVRPSAAEVGLVHSL